MMPTTVPNSPTNGAVEPMVAKRADAALQFGVNDGFGAFQSALGGFDLFTRNLRADLMRLEFLQTGHDDLRQMALLVRSAIFTASSSLPSRSAPATAGANWRDCLRAAL